MIFAGFFEQAFQRTPAWPPNFHTGISNPDKKAMKTTGCCKSLVLLAE
jgi:hypothetical protein